MTLIEQKLIDSYTILVLANKYIIKEEDRVKPSQLLVPLKFQQDIEIKVAEKIIEILSNTL